jgi:hypothetical protein
VQISYKPFIVTEHLVSAFKWKLQHSAVKHILKIAAVVRTNN